MTNPLALKLAHGTDLTDLDRAKLDAVVSESRQVGPHTDLIREGDAPSKVNLVLEGLACRYKVLPDGRRQIMAFLVPGDFCDLQVAILGEMDHGIATLAPCRVVEIDRTTIEDLITAYPRIARGLWWATLVDEAVLREWLVNMGQRPADARMAHAFCEILLRLQAVDRASDNSCDFPLTQEELGDTLGLSIVHVNRTLQHLRQEGLIVLRGKILTIPDVDRLRTFATFNPNYLHLGRRDGTRRQATLERTRSSHQSEPTA